MKPPKDPPRLDLGHSAHDNAELRRAMLALSSESPDELSLQRMRERFALQLEQEPWPPSLDTLGANAHSPGPWWNLQGWLAGSGKWWSGLLLFVGAGALGLSAFLSTPRANVTLPNGTPPSPSSEIPVLEASHLAVTGPPAEATISAIDERLPPGESNANRAPAKRGVGYRHAEAITRQPSTRRVARTTEQRSDTSKTVATDPPGPVMQPERAAEWDGSERDENPLTPPSRPAAASVQSSSLPSPAPQPPAAPAVRSAQQSATTAVAATKLPPKTGQSAFKDEATLLQQARKRATRDPRGALALLDEHARSFADGSLVQEREMLAIDVLRSLGRDAQARVRLAAFARAFPHSVYLQQAR